MKAIADFMDFDPNALPSVVRVVEQEATPEPEPEPEPEPDPKDQVVEAVGNLQALLGELASTLTGGTPSNKNEEDAGPARSGAAGRRARPGTR